MSFMRQEAERMCTGLALHLKLISSMMMRVPNALASFEMTGGISCLLLPFSCFWLSFLVCGRRKYISKGVVYLTSGS